MDALDDEELDELAWLFSPLAQISLQRVLNLNEEGALFVTRRTVKWIAEMTDAGYGLRLRKLIGQRAYEILAAERYL